MKDYEHVSLDVELSRVEDADKTGPYLKTKVMIERTELRMNPDFPDDAKCDCGHAYYRHFDGYENWAPVGCKYCRCYEWHPPVKKAGLIPYYIKDGVINMMFMISSDPHYGGPLPQISKGYIDPTDDSSKAGAIREATEELGFNIKNVRFEDIGVDKVDSVNIITGDHKDYSFAMYVAEVLDKDNFGTPHFETGSVVWMTPAEFMSGGREAHRHPVMQATLQIVHNHEFRTDAPVNDVDFTEVTK